MPVVTMRELLECGVHFGHQTKRWNPKMKKYIFTARNDIHVIDLQKTLKLIEKTYHIVKEVSASGGKFLFVGTKKQAQEAIMSEAGRCEMFYVNQRWLGGTLTNHTTIRKSIAKLKKFEKMKDENVLDSLTKKEAAIIKKEMNQLTHYLGGIKEMVRVPDMMIVIDTKKEQLAIKEANRLGIPVVGIIDTNADPTEVKYPIPANDDAIRAIKLICSIMANAIIEGKQGGGSSQTAEIAEAEETTLDDIEVVKEEMDDPAMIMDEMVEIVEMDLEDIEAQKIVKVRKKKGTSDEVNEEE